MKEYDSQGRGKCEDILDDASYAISNALEIIQSLTNLGNRENAVLASFTKFLEHHSVTINRLKQECKAINHEHRDEKLFLHICTVNSFIELPTLVSRGLLLIQNWRNQFANPLFSNDLEFGERLVSDAFSDLNIEAEPILLFADRFAAFDIGGYYFVTIPYVFHNKYDHWWGIAHEIGHAYFSRFQQDIDLPSLTKEIKQVIADAAPLKEKKMTKMELESNIVVWASYWLRELLSDYVALCLFGLHYLSEMHHSYSEITIGLASKSHPPMGFRLTCLRWALEYSEIDLKGKESVFEYPLPLSQQMEPILSVLTSSKMARVFAKWMLSQAPYQRLKVRWSEILNLGKDEISLDVSLVILFASICVMNCGKSEVQDLLLALKKKVIEDKNKEIG